MFILLGAGVARANGERITDVRVIGNLRTNEDTILSLAGVRINDTLEEETLGLVRERLNTSGLFADVNVWWESHGDGVRVDIKVKDKFPWAPVPTGSWSANNASLGLVFVHGNLFGRGKQALIGARLARLDSGAVIVYRDPALFGSWAYWEMKGVAQRQVIPEYNIGDSRRNPTSPWRQTTFDSFGIEPALGVAWFRRVRTQVSWRMDRVTYVTGKERLFDPETGIELPLPPAPNAEALTSRGGKMGIGRASLSLDWRSREFAVMTGPALGGELEVAGSEFNSDFTFWRIGAHWEQGIRFFRRCNLIYSAGGTLAHDTPIWWDPTAGGNGLRGYLVQQFRGDTALGGHVEYHFPLFSVGSLDVRGLGFYDMAAVWNRSLPTTQTPSGYLIRTEDLRTFDPRYVALGFDRQRDLHNDVGVGLRFFLRSVAVPLVGFDAGYGLEAGVVRFILLVGA